MRQSTYQVGMIIENTLGQFAKIMTLRNGVYGLSGWTTKVNAEKAEAPAFHLNRYGLDRSVVNAHAGKPVKKASGAAPKKTASKKTVKKAAKKVAKKTAK